jgi:ABC-type sugar transport system substrate-binding protein
LDGAVVIRDFESNPKGRVLAIVVRDNRYEAEQAAQYMCDLLNKDVAAQQ